MKNFKFFYALVFLTVLLSGCTSTFAGSVFVFTFRDIIYYIGLAFVFALIISLMSGNNKKTFWLWVILNLLLTPLVGFIYLLIKMSKK